MLQFKTVTDPGDHAMNVDAWYVGLSYPKFHLISVNISSWKNAMKRTLFAKKKVGRLPPQQCIMIEISRAGHLSNGKNYTNWNELRHSKYEILCLHYHLEFTVIVGFPRYVECRLPFREFSWNFSISVLVSYVVQLCLWWFHSDTNTLKVDRLIQERVGYHLILDPASLHNGIHILSIIFRSFAPQDGEIYGFERSWRRDIKHVRYTGDFRVDQENLKNADNYKIIQSYN